MGLLRRNSQFLGPLPQYTGIKTAPREAPSSLSGEVWAGRPPRPHPALEVLPDMLVSDLVMEDNLPSLDQCTKLLGTSVG